MSPVDGRSYADGVRDALNIARAASEALRVSTGYLPTRWEFAAAALEELADAGEELLLGPASSTKVPAEPPAGE